MGRGCLNNRSQDEVSRNRPHSWFRVHAHGLRLIRKCRSVRLPYVAEKRFGAMAEQSTALSTATTTSKRQMTARALLLGERIDLAGLERSDLISATPMAFRAGQEGYAVLFRYGAVVLIGLSVLEEDGLIRSVQPRITGAFARREDAGVTIEVVVEGDET